MQLSHHALEQINSRKISETQIFEALLCGSRWHCPHDPEIIYTRHNRVFVVTAGGSWVLTAYILEEEYGFTPDAGKR